jgi:cytoskeletal protein CcmA (bactofilin family)
MGKKRIVFAAVLALILSSMKLNLIYAEPKRFEAANYRVGPNVIVAPDEMISGGLLVAGANAEVSGNVRDGLKAFGANLIIPGNIRGELICLGANVILSGRYQNKVKGAAANVILSGTFDDNVEVAAAKITVTSTAIIKGSLTYAAAVLDQQEGSQIIGTVIQKKVEKKEMERRGQKARRTLSWLWVLCWIISIPALLIVGVLTNYLFPRETEAIVSTLSESPWKSLGIGLVFLVVVPVAIIISLITLVGIPAGIIASLLYGIFLYISRIYMGLWIGRKVLGYVRKPLATAFFWPLVVGVIIIALLGFIPFIGWFFRLFILLISLGAMVVVIWRSLQPKKQALDQASPAEDT